MLIHLCHTPLLERYSSRSQGQMVITACLCLVSSKDTERRLTIIARRVGYCKPSLCMFFSLRFKTPCKMLVCNLYSTVWDCMWYEATTLTGLGLTQLLSSQLLFPGLGTNMFSFFYMFHKRSGFTFWLCLFCPDRRREFRVWIFSGDLASISVLTEA